MWVILPVKQLLGAKHRLAPLLSPQQRAQLSYLMCDDVLDTLSSTDVIQGITVISSDISVIDLANHFGAEHLLLEADGGYSADTTHAINTIVDPDIDKVAIIPSDVPQLTHAGLQTLDRAHHAGITLCPAVMDGGTNAIVFSPPLHIPLMFGPDSQTRHRQQAQSLNIPVNIQAVPGLDRDIDRPEDLLWLGRQLSGKKAWAYVRGLSADFPDKQLNTDNITTSM